jgi:hypothetical protein
MSPTSYLTAPPRDDILILYALGPSHCQIAKDYQLLHDYPGRVVDVVEEVLELFTPNKAPIASMSC